MTSILIFAGSARKESFNKKLSRCAAAIAKDEGAEVTLIDLADYPMPMYDGDLEEAEGQPTHAKTLHDMIQSHDAMLIASPEYNGLPTPLLKNTIDWITRVNVKVFDGKTAAIVSASPGALGGMRGLPHLRTLLTNLNTLVVPQQLTVSKAAEAFDENGTLKDAKQSSMLTSVVKALIHVSR